MYGCIRKWKITDKYTNEYMTDSLYTKHDKLKKKHHDLLNAHVDLLNQNVLLHDRVIDLERQLNSLNVVLSRKITDIDL